MIKETLYLQDGWAMRFSGQKIAFEIQDITAERMMPVLPYTRQQIEVAGHPRHFLDYIGDLTESSDTLIYFLSLIPSGRTDFGYWLFIQGEARTGKTVFLNVLKELFDNAASDRIPAESFFHAKNKKLKKLSPALEVANNKLLSFSDDATAVDSDVLNTEAIATVTGDKNLIFFYQRNSFTVRPSAQYLFASNYAFTCVPASPSDEELLQRLILFRFEHQFAEWERKSPEAILQDLRPEFPAVIKFLVTRYMQLRDEFHGKIPISDKCLAEKEHFISFNTGANK